MPPMDGIPFLYESVLKIIRRRNKVKIDPAASAPLAKSALYITLYSRSV